MLNAARSTFNMAQTAEPNSDDWHKLLEETIEACGNIHKDYPQRLAGVTARFYQGRSYQQLGDTKQALVAFGELIADLPDGDSNVRQLKTQAFRYALECWLEDKDYAVAVDKTLLWARSARGSELQDADWLAVKLSSATALEGLADSATKKDAKTRGFLRNAREMAGEVLRLSSDQKVQAQARDLLAQLDSQSTRTAAVATTKEASKEAAADHKAKSFDDAYQRGNDAVDQLKSDQLELTLIQKDPNPDVARVAELKTEIKSKSDEAFAMFQRAVELADAKSDPEKLNFARYLLCYFHYENGDYYDAALLGEFLAKRFPDSANARPAARIALAAFDALYRQHQHDGDKDLSFERDKIFDLAKYITNRWADQPEADLALDLLIGFYINSGDYQKGSELLNHIKADSPHRADAEAKLGQALWNKYLRGAGIARARNRRRRQFVGRAGK